MIILMLKIFFSLVLVSAILIGIYYAGNTVINMYKNQDNLRVETGSPLSQTFYKTEIQKENNTQSKYTIDIKYPQIVGLGDSDVEKTINSQIKLQVDNYIAGFKKEVASASNTAVPPQLQANLTITFTPAQMDDEIVSFAWNVSDMQAGAAHPNNYTNVFNYSVSENKMITLSNLFKPNSNYLNVLETQATPPLKAKLEKENYYFAEMFNPGVTPTAQNYQNFLLDKNNLVIIFDYYQVAPYVVGTTNINIPYSNIQNILNPNLNLQ